MHRRYVEVVLKKFYRILGRWDMVYLDNFSVTYCLIDFSISYWSKFLGSHLPSRMLGIYYSICDKASSHLTLLDEKS